jgi:hypothetical protein
MPEPIPIHAIEWTLIGADTWEARVPYCLKYGEKGTFILRAHPRPSYCDRGDWLMEIEEVPAQPWGVLDSQDGFPRYFFGSEEDVKQQFALWLAKQHQQHVE